MEPIKHIWFDFSDTIASLTKEHAVFLFQTYAEAVGKPASPELQREFESARKTYKSYASVFTNGLGLPAGYWSKKIQAAGAERFYGLKAANIPEVLDVLRQKCPLSIFSNIQMGTLLPALGIDRLWFRHFLSSADVKNPKPALDGFLKAVELSELPAENMLFVGDDLAKDLAPAKEVGMQTGLMWSESPEADYSFKKFEDILTLFP